MVDLVEYKRPLIVLLIFASLIFLATNFGGHMFSSEMFVDPPYKCATGASTRNECIRMGGFWKDDGGRPAECNPTCMCCVPNAAFPLSVSYPATACPASDNTFTYTDTMKIADNSFLPSNTNKPLSADEVRTHLKTLEDSKRLMLAPKIGDKTADIYAYLQSDEAALTAMQGEYCYYAARYRYCVVKIIETPPATSSSASTGPSASGSQASDWVVAARTLNVRLMNLVLIMKALTEARMLMGSEMGAGVAKLNADLSVRMNKLSEQSNDLVNGNSSAILHKKMVQYTRQKAKANGNLVLLYTFMNLIALGMLFYVYRAT